MATKKPKTLQDSKKLKSRKQGPGAKNAMLSRKVTTAPPKPALPKKFKVHKMYSKSGIMKTAKTMADHNRLKKQGYGHTKPKKK